MGCLLHDTREVSVSDVLRRSICVTRLLPLLLLLTLPAVVHAGQFGDFTYTNTGIAITITGYTGPGGVVTIPDIIDLLPVTRIGDSAFYSCTNLTSVVIPDSVTNIGDSAFGGCTRLTSVTIPNSVTSMGGGAFYFCSSLTNVTIGTNVTGIGENAFAWCTSLTSVTIPGSVTSMGNWAFARCAGLTSVTIPNSVTSMGGGAFYYCASLTSITIPNSVTSIGDSAFQECSSLSSVTIGTSVTGIGGNAFAGCTSLASVTIPNSVTSIGEWAFHYCTNMSSVTIGNGVTTIGQYAFQDCFSLICVTIPDSVTSMGKGMFYSCTRLTSVTIGTNVTSIGDSAFGGCTNLTSVTIPNSVTSMGGGAFYFCSSLTNVTIGTNVTGIGENAFAWCTSLTSVTIPGSVTSMGNWAFARCAGLTSVTIPNSVTSMGGGAFYYCASLTSITIPNSVTSIGDSAFQECSSLSSVTIGTSVTGIGGNAFAGCTSLASVTIPNSVTSIGEWAFHYCTNMSSVTIGSGVTSIGQYVFQDCISLSSVTIPNSVTSMGRGVFQGCVGLTSVTIGNGVTSIGNWTFYYCTSLTSVTIPNSVTSIGAAAFYHCASLTSVTIGTNVTGIGENAFQDCSSLMGVYFVGNAPSADSTVFSNANNATVYYRLGTTGWPTVPGLWANRPTALWTAVATCDEAALDAALSNNNGEVFFACDGTVHITTTKVISSNVTLDATGHSITISGSNNVGVFSVDPGIHLTLRNFTIANGRAQDGGGINNNGGIVTAADCAFSSNVAVGAANGIDAHGGAIYNYNGGTLILTCSTFVTNRATGGTGSTGTSGGGSGIPGGPGGTGGNGSGGGICNNGGTVAITNCTFSGNQSSGGSGGTGGHGGDGYSYQYICGYYTCGPQGQQCPIYCWTNTSGGPGGQGGDGGDGYGGGICNNAGTVMVVNVTLAYGGATPGSGGLPGTPGTYGDGDGGSGSSGGGYGGNTSGQLILENTILGHGSPVSHCCGSIIDNGHNICSDVSAGFYQSSSMNYYTGPLLAGAPADNGGPTPTIALLEESAAINSGSDLVAPTTDQRHIPRAGPSDIGAYEFEMRIIGVSGNLAFGHVTVGQTAVAAMTITNNGNVTLTVTNIDYPEGFSGVRTRTVGARNATSVTVSFAPTALQSYGGTITIFSDAASGTNTITCSGTGYHISTNIGPYTGGNTITITNGNFGTITNVLVGGVKATIQNSGANWVTITIPTIGTDGVKGIVIQTDTGDITLADAYTVNPAGKIGCFVGDWTRWQEVAGLPAARCILAAGVLDGALYAVGGHTGGGGATNVYRCNGANWTEVAGLPAARYGLAAEVVNGALYAVGGAGSGAARTNVYRYNGTNWTEVAGLPAPRYDHAVGVLNGALYSVGGTDGTGNRTNVYRYDGTNWTEVAGLPAARSRHAAGMLNGALYTVGGDNSGSKTNMYRYDGAIWQEVAGLPAARYAMAVGVLNAGLYTVGGYDSNTKTNVYRYDGTNWTEVAGLATARSSFAVGALNEALYAVGGSDGSSYKTNVYRYPAFVGSGVSPTSGSWTGGYPVVISGTNLCNGSDITNVTLCGVAAAILPGQSATQVVVTAGASAVAGLGDVRVYSVSFGETVKSNVFTYIKTDATLTIQSLHGTGTPAVGIYTNLIGSVLTNLITSSDPQGTTQYICSGWAMTGNGPASGTTNRCVMTVTNDATLTWLWTTNYWLDTTAGEHGSVNVGDRWLAFGVTTAITATAESHHHFTNWTGDASGNVNPLNLLIDAPKSVTANFAENQTTNTGTPEWWLAGCYPGTNDFENAAMSDTDGDGFRAWQEWIALTVPTDGLDYLRIENNRSALDFMAHTNRLYGINSTTNLLAPEWLSVTSNVEGTESICTVTNVTGSTSIYYRLKVRMKN